MRILRRQLIPSVALVLVAIAGTVLPAAAADVVKQSGTIGSYSYSDTEGDTGCPL